jgi:hypothetical protein
LIKIVWLTLLVKHSQEVIVDRQVVVHDENTAIRVIRRHESELLLSHKTTCYPAFANTVWAEGFLS